MLYATLWQHDAAACDSDEFRLLQPVASALATWQQYCYY
jgi:hypothetical protein